MPERQDVRMSEFHIINKSVCQYVWMSGCQDARMSEFHIINKSLCQYVWMSGCQAVSAARLSLCLYLLFFYLAPFVLMI